MDLTFLWIALGTFVAVGYWYVKKQHNFWKDLDLPFIKPKFLIGSLSGVGTTITFADLMQNAYREMKGKAVMGGMYFFTQPIGILLDLDLVKTIMVKDFQYFHDRGVYVNERDDPLSGHLFSLAGQRWKVMRTKLSPTFTSGKMKMMHHTIIAVAQEFQKYFENYAVTGEEFEMKDLNARFTTDVIGNCAFGIECNSLKEPDNEFRKIGKKVFDFDKIELMRQFFIQSFPDLAKKLRMSSNSKDVTDFFLNLLRDTLEYREKNSVERKDFLSLLIQLKNTGKLEGDNVDLGKISFEELAAQVFVFFVAGFETSSSTMTFALYELAVNQDVQDKAREEIHQVLEKHGGEFTYDACMEMKYLDRIINETLRKYPIVDSLQRIATNDYTIPGTNKVITKGTLLFIPVFAFQRDPEIYPNPERFDPDRFTDENLTKRHPFSWLPFGEGPRICIGMRFGMMQTRVGLATLLNKYRINVTQKTPIPLVFDPKAALLQAKGGMWLKVEKL